MMTIKVIPYEDRKKDGNNFYLVRSEVELIARACNHLNFAEIKQLIGILDNFDPAKNILQIDNLNFEFAA